MLLKIRLLFQKLLLARIYENQKWADRRIFSRNQWVYLKNLKTNIDGRGDLTELWSQPWSDKEPIASEIKHVYFNTTHEGIIKAWHAHEFTQSQYACVQGEIQVVLIDARNDSKTFSHVNQFIIGTQNRV